MAAQGAAAGGDFDRMWSALLPIGRHAASGGYRRYAWTAADAALREWFAGEASARGLDLTADRAGNQWAWWGDPDRSGFADRGAVDAGRGVAVGSGRGVAVGSHLDSVPDGGAFDGPLGVVSAFAAVDALRERGFVPSVPLGVVNFGDEEGARFGVACAGSRIITGALDPDRARGLRDADGVSLADAMAAAGHHPEHLGRDAETLRRVGTFVELHVEQGRRLVELDRPVAVGASIWPHGRWRLDLVGEANHAGTTALADRRDPMLDLAAVVLAARRAAEARDCLATVGKVRVEPNGVNAIAARVTAWLDARGPVAAEVRSVAEAVAAAAGTGAVEESFTDETSFDPALTAQLSTLVVGAPLMGTGAGHDAGILALAGVSAAMLFVRNPTGVSHSPAEHAERSDCLAGVAALTEVLADLCR